MTYATRYLIPLCAAALLAAGCDEPTRATAPDAGSPAPALAEPAAAALAVTLDDVLVRLLPARAEGKPLGKAVQSLRAALGTADARGLSRGLAAVRDAVAHEAMESADADALLLALDEIERAVAGNR